MSEDFSTSSCICFKAVSVPFPRWKQCRWDESKDLIISAEVFVSRVDTNVSKGKVLLSIEFHCYPWDSLFRCLCNCVDSSNGNLVLFSKHDRISYFGVNQGRFRIVVAGVAWHS